MADLPDVVVVGSGPAGAIAAWTLLERGLRVVMVDVGHDDPESRAKVPDLPFHEVRATDVRQRSYFVGDHDEGVPQSDVKVGAQLTPPRQFLTRDTEALLPYRSDSFSPMLSLALGGLGGGWGAAAFSFDADELRRCGLDEPGFEAHYQRVVAHVGVSAALDGDAAPHLVPGLTGTQPALELDTNASTLFDAYRARREQMHRAGLFLGPASLAVLSQPLGDRAPNPYFDMDFWSDSRRSVYRPRYTIEALRRDPRFEYRPGLLAVRFTSGPGAVELTCLDVRTRQWAPVKARRLLLCAGSLNSARLALHSLGLSEHRAPLLCNPYTYLPTVNLRMLGRAAADRRHSLAQLCGAFVPPGETDRVSVQVYSYRSLLLFKLVKELPLPPAAGLLAARLLCNALTIFGVHHSDAPSPHNWLRLGAPTAEGLPTVEFAYAPPPEVTAARTRREGALKALLFKLGCVPYSSVRPGHAASIHYAGTIPAGGEAATFGAHRDGRLQHAEHVWVGDSATWRELPAKGLTLTLMANASRVATHLAAQLQGAAA